MRRFYPELDLWYREGLFTRTNLGGYNFSINQKQRYITHIRSVFFECHRSDNMGQSRVESRISSLEIQAWRRAKVFDAFRYIGDRDMRKIMRAMILYEGPEVPLPSARDVAKRLGYIWPQFVTDFNYALWQMYNAGALV